MTNMFMKEQQQAKRLAQKKTEWAIARGQELGEVLQMNQYRERLNAAMKVTDEGVSEAAHRAALDMRDRARRVNDANKPPYVTAGLVHKVAHDMRMHIGMTPDDAQQPHTHDGTAETSSYGDGDSDDDFDPEQKQVRELELKVLEAQNQLAEAQKDLVNSSASPPPRNRTPLRHTPKQTRARPNPSHRTPPFTHGATRQSPRRTSPFVGGTAKKARGKTPAKRTPKPRTPATDSTDSLSNVSSPSDSSHGESFIALNYDVDDDKDEHLLNVPTKFGNVRMVRAETSQSKVLMASIHSEGAAVGVQKLYRGHLARMHTAELNVTQRCSTLGLTQPPDHAFRLTSSAYAMLMPIPPHLCM